ncbi:hypothetical protein [Bosea lupini]|nr:hypothetical protein [Bosea lupini]
MRADVLSGDYLHAAARAAIDRMLAAARANRVPVMDPVFNPDPVEAGRQRNDWLARGATMFVVGTDKIIVADAVSRYASALR